MRDRILHGLADGDAQAARVTRGPRPARRARRWSGRWGWRHVGAPELHHAAPVRLLLVAHLDHVDHHVEAEHLAGHGEGAAPLAGAGLGGDAGGALLLVVVGLRYGRVALVRAGRADAFVLVEDLGGRVERLLQARGTDERRRPPDAVDLTDLVGDLDVALRRDLLRDELGGKIGARSSGPAGCRVPGCSGGAGGSGRSATMLYHALGILSSSTTNFLRVMTHLLLERCKAVWCTSGALLLRVRVGH